MSKWVIKAAIQGTLSLLPNPQRWNRMFQEHVTKSLELRESYFESKWHQCERHAQTCARHLGDEHPSFSALELGTGWFPISPIGLALLGGHTVYSIDTHDLLAHNRVVETLRMCRNLAEKGRIVLGGADAERKLMTALDSASALSARDLLASLGVHAIVGDARAIDLDRGSIDLLYSNNTLEHIPRDVILDIFREFGRLISPRGLMSHHIDLCDHYAYADRSITVYNFLRFSPRVWTLFNNQLQWQNRLRISDYRAIHREAGWTLVEEHSIRKSVDVLRSVPLANEFRTYSEDDLAVASTWMTSTREEPAGEFTFA